MTPIRILIDTFADEGETNAQMSNAREIIVRLNAERFHVTTFKTGKLDSRIEARPNTKVVSLPIRRQTVPILRQSLFGDHDLLFYPKASPAMKWYMKMKTVRGRRGLVVGTVESQMNLRDELTVNSKTVRLIEQTVLRADYLFSNANSVAQSLHSHYGRLSEVIPTGVDTMFFTPTDQTPRNVRPRVLFVGSLRPFKGPHLLIDAAERFPQADFVIVGEGTMASELKARSNKKANVTITGALSMSAVRDEYRASDVFLFPSRWEGSPKVIMEASACALPVISFRDYEPETVVDGNTGYLVSSTDELFSRLETLILDREMRRRMGQSARAHVAKFDWNVVTRQWEDVFLRLVTQSQ